MSFDAWAVRVTGVFCENLFRCHSGNPTGVLLTKSFDSCLAKPSGLAIVWPLQLTPSGVFCNGSQGSYLVDPASSHMLVSKIKPCMSKYKLLIL